MIRRGRWGMGGYFIGDGLLGGWIDALGSIYETLVN